jgi:hypothetical protein
LANQGKQTSVFRFRLQQTNGSLPFPFSVCSKQTEVCRCRFPFAANKRKFLFTVSSVFYLRNSRDMETWKNKDMETWRQGDMSLSFVRLSMKKQTEIGRLQTD